MQSQKYIQTEPKLSTNKSFLSWNPNLTIILTKSAYCSFTLQMSKQQNSNIFLGVILENSIKKAKKIEFLLNLTIWMKCWLC